jgi:hypothetical protein
MFDCPEAACKIGGFSVGRYFDGEGIARVVAAVAQLVERLLGKDEVMGSNPISSWFGVSWRFSRSLRDGRAADQAVMV